MINNKKLNNIKELTIKKLMSENIVFDGFFYEKKAIIIKSEKRYIEAKFNQETIRLKRKSAFLYEYNNNTYISESNYVYQKKKLFNQNFIP